MNNRIFWIVSIILMFFAGLSLSTFLPHIYDVSKEPQMAKIPLMIGDWRGKDIPIPEQDYAILATNNLIMREYEAPGTSSIILYVIYSGNNRKSLHPPEICYTGAGGTILRESVIPLTADIKANRFTIDERGFKEMVVYWFRTNNLNTSSYITQQFRTALQRTFGRKASGAMIRISTVINSGNDQQALKNIQEFVRRIETILPEYIP